MARRNEGSTRMAWLVGVLLFILAIIRWQLPVIHWDVVGRWVDIGSCLAFALILFIWAASKKPSDHPAGTKWKIGNETVTMVVTIIAAIVAIFALTDAASKPTGPTGTQNAVTASSATASRPK